MTGSKYVTLRLPRRQVKLITRSKKKSLKQPSVNTVSDNTVVTVFICNNHANNEIYIHILYIIDVVLQFLTVATGGQ